MRRGDERAQVKVGIHAAWRHESIPVKRRTHIWLELLRNRVALIRGYGPRFAAIDAEAIDGCSRAQRIGQSAPRVGDHSVVVALRAFRGDENSIVTMHSGISSHI